IWLAIYWARWIPYLYSDARDSADVAPKFVVGVVLVLGAAFVLVMWFFPRTIARRVLPEGDPVPATIAAPSTWFATGCALIGVWVLTDAIPGLAQKVFFYVYSQRTQIERRTGWDSALVYYLVELVVAIWLLLGAAGLRKLVAWARGAEAP